MSFCRGPVSVLLCGMATACRCGPGHADGDGSGSVSAASAGSDSAAVHTQRPERLERYDLVAHVAGCEVRHRGVLLDIGTTAARARRAFAVDPFEDVIDKEREGVTVGRVMAARVAFDVVTDEPQEDAQLSVRAFGGAARTMTAVLDDRRLGSVKLVPNEVKVHDFPIAKGTLAAGAHRVTLTFAGRSRGASGAAAELDWLRLGPAEEGSSSYAAPTFKDVIADAVLDGAPRRALALRAPASLRCPMIVAPDTELRADLGFWGDGKGTADVRVLADGESPTVISERKITGGSGATWVPLAIPLKEHAGKLIALELRALESSKGGRILFGDPAIVRPTIAKSVPKASTVVVVVASGLDRRAVPPWGRTPGLGSFAELARTSAVFSSCRAPTTVPSAAVASLLTGLPPSIHGLEDPAARLPGAARIVAERMKESNGRTAMFTSVPTTFGAFGFEAGWDHFETFSPVRDVEAAASISGAARWLDAEIGEADAGRHLVVIHARGAHPPWDVTREEQGRLPPEEYPGLLDARRGGIVLGRLRAHKKHHKRLAEEDWVRLRALVATALAKQDVALGQLIAVLKKKNVWDSTLFVLVGDVAPGDPPDVPFDPAGPLTEDRLLVPLLIKFPGGELAAKEVGALVTTFDVTTTVLSALGLEHGDGLDLYSVAQGFEPISGRGLVATLGDQFSTRFGSWLLRGNIGKAPSLCQLDVDPACTTDVFASRPIAGWAAWQWTYDAFEAASRRRIAAREPASIDPDLGAALTVWGDI
jgi:arylsulfatase A-like enzyme